MTAIREVHMLKNLFSCSSAQWNDKFISILQRHSRLVLDGAASERMNTAGISSPFGGHCRGTNGSRWPHENERKEETEKCEAETRSKETEEVSVQQRASRKRLLFHFYLVLKNDFINTLWPTHATGLLNWGFEDSWQAQEQFGFLELKSG